MSTGPGRKPRVTDEQIVEVFRASDDPVLSTSEVADELPIGRRGTLKRLQSLVEDGTLESKPIGGRNTVWWLSENDIADSGLSRETVTDERTPTFEAPEPTESAEEQPLEALDFPQGKDRDECIEAVLAARDYLEGAGNATMRDFVTEVMPDHPIGYDVPDLQPGDRYRGAWWRKIVKPGLKALPDVEYRDGHHDYRYVGE